MSELAYRPNVCILVCNGEGKLFLGERCGEPGIWQFPQGGAEPNFSLEENVLRELHEELGVKPSSFSILQKLQATHRYDFARVPPYAVGIWRGQDQTFWLVKFLGADSEIKLDHMEPEFTAWQWCTPAETRAIAEPKRLPAYEPAIKEFEKYLASLPS